LSHFSLNNPVEPQQPSNLEDGVDKVEYEECDHEPDGICPVQVKVQRDQSQHDQEFYDGDQHKAVGEVAELPLAGFKKH